MNNANPVSLRDNVVRMEGNIAIESRFGGAVIESNFIEGANTAIRTLADPGAAGGDLIEDNVIGESGGTGIVIENDFNEVLGNSIYGSTDEGIRVNHPAPSLVTTGNLIGGDAPTDENNIRESGGNAIEIVDNSGSTEEDSFNEVARNKGEENEGLFIDLVGNANAGIQPPPFATSMQSSAGGTGAEANARIRVFRKESGDPGELESFLGEAVADGSGNWKVTYLPRSRWGRSSPPRRRTRRVAPRSWPRRRRRPTPAAAQDAGRQCHRPEPPPVPQTKITKGPKAKTHATTAKFKFTSSEKGSTFECKLDKKKFKPCKSPKTYKKLKPGKHVFKVRAVKAGVADPTPAKRKFKILE